MVKLNTTMMTVGILVTLIFTGLPCLEALSPMGAPTMSRAPVKSPGAPTTTTAPAPAPAVDCVAAFSNVTDCFTFVQVGSNLTVPDKGCCPEFAGLLESNPICLCQLIGQADNFGVDLNKALMLPNACKLEVPSLDSCPASPSSAPTPVSAGEAPGSTAAGPGTNGEASLGPTGSGTGGSNAASSTAVHDLSTIVCLAVAIFIAYYF
ncbi:hypothetical protein E3N88_11007 [Mikania micrantha]|uniref:Bifunctional inhibitor/plant lipid transfer protein/seed storage helical domain-containing protein n=1 Tax=Mikania micrantha TaxID=192012 RepID=A0A5N6PF50_9ASTR|nr:hypothetical protein E3N88_11007 [Mikania micrantha]